MVEKSGECFLMYIIQRLYNRGSVKSRKNEEEKAACYLIPRVSQNRPVELGFCSVNLIKLILSRANLIPSGKSQLLHTASCNFPVLLPHTVL